MLKYNTEDDFFFLCSNFKCGTCNDLVMMIYTYLMQYSDIKDLF